MKTKFIWLGIIASIIGIGTFFIGCDSDVNGIVTYHGQVVHVNTTTPFADLTVKVTDGQNTHCQTQTNADGMFSLKVRVDEIDGSYYLLAGDSTCIPKKVALGGYGQTTVDLDVIEVEGPALPTIITTPLQSVKADEAILGGEVQTDGRMSVTARGVCYGMEPYPTIDGLHTIDGSGLGSFTSTLKNLEYNTIYYARAYATNKKGTAYGDQVKFTTEEGVAIVVTDSVIRVTAHSAKCKGHIESDGGFPVTKRGACWSKRPDPTVDDDCTDDGSGLGEFTSTIKDLQENTTYYVRTYATNSTTTSYGEQIIITTLDGLAVVQTDSITAVTATSFTAYGTVVSDCDIPVTARGFCYATTQYPTIDDDIITVGKGLGKYQGNVKNLQVGTTYYVRAYATNATETTYGEQLTITTQTGLPIVITSETTATSTKISSGGNVISDGGYSITARGICYSTNNSSPTIEDSFTRNGKGLGEYTSIITEVTISTTYYICAYATNSIGTAYGKVIAITTGNGLPIVETTPVGENVTATTAVSGGQIIDDGGSAVIARGVCWNTLPYPIIDDNKTTDGSGTGYFSSTIIDIDLAGNNTYYVRAYAVNEKGIAYGQQVLISYENIEYRSLPSIEYAGYIYRIYKDIGEMTWNDANNACEGLIYGGYDDWMLPDYEELRNIMTNYKYGWYKSNGESWIYIPYSNSQKSGVDASDHYWSRDDCEEQGKKKTLYYFLDYYDVFDVGYKRYYYNLNYPTSNCCNPLSTYRVRPIRKYKKEN